MKTILLSVALTNVLSSNYFTSKGRPEVPNDFYTNPIHQQQPRNYKGPIPDRPMSEKGRHNIRMPEIPEYNFRMPKGFNEPRIIPETVFNGEYINGKALMAKHKQLFGIGSNLMKGINKPNIQLNSNIHRGKGMNQPNYIPNNNIHKGNGYTPQFIDISQQNPGHQWLNNAGFPVSSNSKGFPSKGFPSKGGQPNPRPTPQPIATTIHQTTIHQTTTQPVTNTPTTQPSMIPTASPVVLTNACINNIGRRYNFMDPSDDNMDLSICNDVVNGDNLLYVAIADTTPNNNPIGVGRGTVSVNGNVTTFNIDFVKTKNINTGSNTQCFESTQYTITCTEFNGLTYIISMPIGNNQHIAPLTVTGTSSNQLCFKPEGKFNELTTPYLITSIIPPPDLIRQIHTDTNGCLNDNRGSPSVACTINDIRTIFDNDVKISCCGNTGSLAIITDNTPQNRQMRIIYDRYNGNSIIRSPSAFIYNVFESTTAQCPL